MRLLAPLLMALVAACSNGHAASPLEPADAERISTPVKAAIPLAGWVTDEANIIGALQEAELSNQLTRFERETKHQMVVVSVKSLNGQDVADFTRDLGNAWGIGRKDYDDGVVVLVAPNERMVRIAVGYGLEQALPDSLCKSIIDEQMLPHFRRGDFEQGIAAEWAL